MAEAVGIILAIAPLIISAIEDYDSTSRRIRAFKGYTQLVKTHLSTLNIQQTIFRKAHERLLSYCLEDDDDARKMLADPDHPLWEDAEIAEQYVKRLGDSRSAFEDSIGLISDELAAIRSVLAKFETPEGEAPRLLKKRIKYALKEGNIERSLSNLTANTRSLVSLIDLSESSHQKVPRLASTLATKRQLTKFCRVKETAEDLYEALGQACTKHTCHQAHLSLEPVYSDTSQIRFTLAFSQLALDQPLTEPGQFSQSAWLTIESSISGRIQSAVDDEGLPMTQKTLKRTFERTNEHGQDAGSAVKPKAIKKCLRFQDEDLEAPSETPKPIGIPPLANLCSHSNFCTHLQKFLMSRHLQPSSSAVGYLELSGPSKHLIYIDNKWQTIKHASASSDLKSLHEVLVGDQAEICTTPLTLVHRIGLAKRLATAVLQFHATPWLRSSWNSKEVLVSTKDIENENERTNPGAYVTTEIQGPHGPLRRAQTSPSPIVVRNVLLFSLGVMLLELAYQRPLNDLTIGRDKDDSSPGNTKYFTANRLSRQVSAHMGPRYAEITRKCVHCDFGCDFDLGQTRLQEGFYQDVVCELDELEQRLKDL